MSRRIRRKVRRAVGTEVGAIEMVLGDKIVSKGIDDGEHCTKRAVRQPVCE